MNEKPNIEKFFNGLNKDTMNLVDEFYDENIEFLDPLVKVKGRDEMRAYYKELYDNVTSIEFKFSNEIMQGDTQGCSMLKNSSIIKYVIQTQSISI